MTGKNGSSSGGPALRDGGAARGARAARRGGAGAGGRLDLGAGGEPRDARERVADDDAFGAVEAGELREQLALPQVRVRRIGVRKVRKAHRVTVLGQAIGQPALPVAGARPAQTVKDQERRGHWRLPYTSHARP